MKRKREKWLLPKTFKTKRSKKGRHQRQDGEPIIHELVRHANDRTLTADTASECCDCGLTHTRTYNVFRVSSGKWYLIERVYRVPSTGKS